MLRKAVVIIVDSRNLFDRYVISLFPLFRYNFDGPVGRRVLFIESKDKHFTVSFEEGMDCLDLRIRQDSTYDEAEYHSGPCYIHQLRTSPSKSFAFFHFEYLDEKGEKLILPGQLFAKEGYTWSESEVEPILVEIMNSIAFNEETEPPSVCAKTEDKAEKTLWQKIKSIIS